MELKSSAKVFDAIRDIKDTLSKSLTNKAQFGALADKLDALKSLALKGLTAKDNDSFRELIINADRHDTFFDSDFDKYCEEKKIDNTADNHEIYLRSLSNQDLLESHREIYHANMSYNDGE